MKQHIRFIPALDVTGYGDTQAKAEEMLRFGLDQLSQELLSADLNGEHPELFA